MQAAIEEVEEMLGIEPLCLGIGIGHTEDLREGGSPR
jgi:hypothetical protein